MATAMPAEPRTLYESFFLTPFRAGLLNMILTGIPFRFGLLPTGILLQEWFHKTLRSLGRLDERLGLASESFPVQPCSVFQNDMNVSSEFCVNNTEVRAVFDMGQSFLHQYGLAWIVFLVIWLRPQRYWIYAMLDFHRVLLTCTLLSLLLLTFFQKPHPHMLTSPPFDSWIPILQVPSEVWSSRFFSSFVFYNLAALSLSLWTLLTRTRHEDRRQRIEDSRRKSSASFMFRGSAQSSSTSSLATSSTNSQEENPPKPNVDDEFMKWSIPANALFYGAVMDGFIAIAQGQALWQHHVHDMYHVSTTEVTPRVMFAFGVQAFYSMINAVWLLRVRSFLSMPQMRYVCAFQAVRYGFAMVWMYQKPQRNQDQGSGENHEYQSWTELEWIMYSSLFGTFMIGFLWAGQATGISKILSSGAEEDLSPRNSSQSRPVGIKLD